MRSRNADTAEKVKALTDKLETGVKAVFESEQYKAYMKAMAKFHRYSFNNVMLILMQCPNATAVAGFNTWKAVHIYGTVSPAACSICRGDYKRNRQSLYTQLCGRLP